MRAKTSLLLSGQSSTNRHLSFSDGSVDPRSQASGFHRVDHGASHRCCACSSALASGGDSLPRGRKRQNATACPSPRGGTQVTSSTEHACTSRSQSAQKATTTMDTGRRPRLVDGLEPISRGWLKSQTDEAWPLRQPNQPKMSHPESWLPSDFST